MSGVLRILCLVFFLGGGGGGKGGRKGERSSRSQQTKRRAKHKVLKIVLAGLSPSMHPGLSILHFHPDLM